MNRLSRVGRGLMGIVLVVGAVGCNTSGGIFQRSVLGSGKDYGLLNDSMYHVGKSLEESDPEANDIESINEVIERAVEFGEILEEVVEKGEIPEEVVENYDLLEEGFSFVCERLEDEDEDGVLSREEIVKHIKEPLEYGKPFIVGSSHSWEEGKVEFEIYDGEKLLLSHIYSEELLGEQRKTLSAKIMKFPVGNYQVVWSLDKEKISEAEFSIK